MNNNRRKFNTLLWTSPMISLTSLPTHGQSSDSNAVCTAAPVITDWHIVGSASAALPPNSPNNGWEFSQDGGVTWSPYDGSVPEVIGPEGSQRIRLVHDFPFPQTVTLTISGNKFDGTTDDGGSVNLDGVQILGDTGGNFNPVSVDVNIATAGVHTIEWLHGDTVDGVGGTSALFIWSNLVPTCIPIMRIEECDGTVRFEMMDGSEYIPTGAEIEGVCP